MFFSFIVSWRLHIRLENSQCIMCGQAEFNIGPISLCQISQTVLQAALHQLWHLEGRRLEPSNKKFKSIFLNEKIKDLKNYSVRCHAGKDITQELSNAILIRTSCCPTITAIQAPSLLSARHAPKSARKHLNLNGK